MSSAARVCSLSVFVAAALAAAACRDATAPPAPVGAVHLSTDSAVVYLDSTLSLSAQLRDAAGNLLSSRPVSWLVFDTTVAKVDASGRLRGVAVGVSTLVAASESVAVQIPVAVVVRYRLVAPGYGVTTDGVPYLLGSPTGPRRIAGASGLVTLTVGREHVCGIAESGAVYCWGSGLLGDGDSASRAGAIRVAAATGLRSVAAGDGFSCGLSQIGEAMCWGESNLLATTTIASLPTPALVVPGRYFALLTAGIGHTCVLTDQGAAYCWGWNRYGQLGAPGGADWCDMETCSATPLKVDSVPALASISAGGAHTCGLTTDGRAFCWGDNGAGQLGDTISTDCFVRHYFPYSPSYPCSQTPMAVSGGLRFASITAGETTTCALTAAGEAYCWGDNSNGEFGDGTTTSSSTPVRAGGSLRFSSLATRVEFDGYCGVGQDGIAYCWGDDRHGALGVGLGPTGIRSRPARVVLQP